MVRVLIVSGIPNKKGLSSSWGRIRKGKTNTVISLSKNNTNKKTHFKGNNKIILLISFTIGIIMSFNGENPYLKIRSLSQLKII